MHPVLSHLPWVNAPSAIFPSSSLATIYVRLGQGPPLGSPKGTSSSLRKLRFRTSVLPYWRQAEWSAVRNSSWLLSAATRCPVMTQDSILFSGDVVFGSGRDRPTCFKGRQVTPLPGVSSPRPWKSDDIKASHSAYSTRLNGSSMSGVTRCTNSHYYWCDFYSPA